MKKTNPGSLHSTAWAAMRALEADGHQPGYPFGYQGGMAVRYFEGGNPSAERLLTFLPGCEPGDYPMPARSDRCHSCEGIGCGDCGNTGLESEAVSHGIR